MTDKTLKVEDELTAIKDDLRADERLQSDSGNFVVYIPVYASSMPSTISIASSLGYLTELTLNNGAASSPFFQGNTDTKRYDPRLRDLIQSKGLDRTTLGLDIVMDRLKKIGELKEGWDTYNAKPIDKKTIDRAIKFFENLFSQSGYKALPVPFIAPLIDGGIHFEWRTFFKEFQYTIPANESEPFTYYKLEKISIDQVTEEESQTYDINEIVNIIMSWL